MTLEDQLMDDILSGKKVDVERGLLILSGCNTEDSIDGYRAKLDELCRQFKYYEMYRQAESRFGAEITPESTARYLHDFIWRGNPYRYRSVQNGGIFLLAHTINAHLGRMKDAGINCVGDSSFYGTMGIRQGLDVRVIKILQHVAIRIMDNGRPIDVETTCPAGFDTKKYVGAEDVGPLGLLASTLDNRGWKKLQMQDNYGCQQDLRKRDAIKEVLASEGNSIRNLVMKIKQEKAAYRGAQ